MNHICQKLALKNRFYLIEERKQFFMERSFWNGKARHHVFTAEY